MYLRLIHTIILLISGLITSIVCMINRFSLEDTLKTILIVLIIFYFFGLIIIVILKKIIDNSSKKSQTIDESNIENSNKK